MEGLATLIKEAARWDFLAQFEAFLKVEDKASGGLVHPRANIHQQRLAEVDKVAREMGRPCRIIGLKPRQKGSSTASVGMGHVRLKAKRAKGLIAGGAHFQGQNLFGMLGTYAATDELDPGECKVMDKEARYKNGSLMQRITLATESPGRSGTYRFMLVTEAALLARDGVANADNVLDGLLKCVPYEPETTIILESTAYGANGYFYDVWQGGITIDEFRAGKSGYVKVFSAWYEFEDSRRDPASVDIYGWDSLRGDEVAYFEDLRTRLGVEVELAQAAWVRWALKEECKGDWNKFKQDYPSDDVTAFLTSGRGVFGTEALAHQEAVARIRPAEYGVLEYREAADRVQWVATGEHQATCVRWETPRVGCTYTISVDVMTGADQTGGDDPDSHSILVHRDGYLQHGEWVEAALVMRNMLVPGTKPGSLCCWWNIDVVEELVWRMARYWQAVIVPEMNMDRGLVELLKLRGDADIYQREMFNRREQVRTTALGWVTDVKTRPMIVEKLAMTLRESGRGEMGVGYEVRCPWIIAQLRNFGTKPNGRMEALVGHDDDVISLAIGNYTRGCGAPWRETERVGRGVVRRVASQWD
jgi:hypothetical protein